MEDVCGLSYWDQMNKMKMLSLLRRLERYQIIYSCTVLKNLVPNCEPQEMKVSAESLFEKAGYHGFLQFIPIKL